MSSYSIGRHGRQTWIDMCQRARVDPHDLVCKHLNVILQNVFDALDDQSQVFLLSSSLYNKPAYMFNFRPMTVNWQVLLTTQSLH